MAQAARLNLRMQKELKLLLTDPPPGASFPLLSPDSDAPFSSLSTINAQIEGPEGTVYERGVFHVTIQIPERYPFQPPSVTFATPIYHPNIDNGGRICLDILNLPPKGAWQPSLNISTVLTSIGLLLSEPNPDDGLMCEVSREYKYNRQTFDEKARSMTEKYAKAGAGGNIHSSHCIETNSSPSMIEFEKIDKSKHEDVVDMNIGSRKKLCGVSRKLSLESSGSTKKRNSDEDVNGIPGHNLISNIENHLEGEGTKRSKSILVEQNSSKHCGTRLKLSLGSFDEFRIRDVNDNAKVATDLGSSQLNPQNVFVTSSGLLLLQSAEYKEQHLHQDLDSEVKNGSINASSETLGPSCQKQTTDVCKTSNETNEKNLHHLSLPFQSHSEASQGALSPKPHAANPLELHHKDAMDRMGNDFTDTRCEKQCSVGKKLSLGLKRSSQSLEKCDKENVKPSHNLSHSHSQNPSINLRIGRKLSLGPVTKLQGSNASNIQSPTCPSKPNETQLPHKAYCGNMTEGVKQQQATEESPISETVIVLDSDNSEEEDNNPIRSKLSLTRKRLGKWKGKALKM